MLLPNLSIRQRIKNKIQIIKNKNNIYYDHKMIVQLLKVYNLIKLFNKLNKTMYNMKQIKNKI